MQPPYIYIISQVRQVRKIKRDKKISIFNTFKAHFVLQVSNMGFLKEKNSLMKDTIKDIRRLPYVYDFRYFLNEDLD